jgi:hypothetical protein
MMYNSKLVCAVKTGGKILREELKDGNAIVTLPFGSEYSLLLKNLSGKRALVNIEIDGKKLAPRGFVLDKGQEYEIERPTDSKRKFKFIEKTEAISDHRGDRIDDSLIRLTWQFEQEATYTYYQVNWSPPVRKRVKKRYPSPWGPIWWYEEEIVEEEVVPWGGVYYSSGSTGYNVGTELGGIKIGASGSNISCSNTMGNATCSTSHTDTPSTPTGEVAKSASAPGITVEGSKSKQRFGEAHMGVLESEIHSMVIQLRGFMGSNPVEKPVTVSSKLYCYSCGKSFKSKFKFCPDDGTALA